MLFDFQDLKPGMPVVVKSAHIPDPTVKLAHDTREDAVYEAYVLKGNRPDCLTLQIVEPMYNGANLATCISVDKMAEGIRITPDPTRPLKGEGYKGYEAQDKDRYRMIDLTTTKPPASASSLQAQTPATRGFAKAAAGIKNFVDNVVLMMKSDFRP